jgi:F0F1-type ATP synthase membrane subunit b/b'
MEIMGKEFRTIDNGLDPNEVVEFLKTAVGSSEDSFKRLEQFSALQAATRAMDESITQARQLAEAAKKQAEEEARQEREQTLKDARERAQEMVDQAKNNCTFLIDDVRTVLTDAISRAFEKAKEIVNINLEDLDNSIHHAGVSHHDQIRENRQQSDGMPSVQPVDTAEAATADDAGDEGAEEVEEEPDHDLMDLERSLTNLEDSLTSLHASASMAEDVPEPQSSEEPEQDVESGEEPSEAKMEDSTSEDDSSESDDEDNQYSGEVLVAIPGGADETWMRELRKRAFQLPGARIKAESGVDDNTTVITLSLKEPTALRSVLEGLPKVEKVLEGQADSETTDKGPMKLLQKISKKSKHPMFIVELDRSSDIPLLL